MRSGPIAWLLGKESRPQRIRVQKFLIVASLALFACSLRMPALQVRIEGEGRPFDVDGANCMILGKAYYASNLLLYITPLICWALRQTRRPVWQLLVACIAIVSFGLVARTDLVVGLTDMLRAWSGYEFENGFWVWAAAHLCSTVALLLPVWGREDDEADLRSQFFRLQYKWLGAKHATPADAS